VTLSRSSELAAESLKAAEENVRLAEKRFDAGTATQLEIRDALLRLTQSQLALLQARVDAVIARADLNRAVGGTL
jgi:outer membrane protein TolC